MKAMMLTAGLGTRLRPVTERLAKPAVPFLNVPLFYYPLSLLEELSLSRLVLNTHHKPQQIEELAARIPGARYQIQISPEPQAPLGSGGGIWQARRWLEGDGNFLVSNGDEVILPHDPQIMQRFAKEHDEDKALATILVMHHPLVGKQFGGVWTNAQNEVQGFGKNPAEFPGCTGYHYIGLLLLNDRVFSYLPEGESNILYDALKAAIAKGEKVRAVVSDFTWYETGNPHDFLHATKDGLRLLAANAPRPDTQTLKKITSRFWSKGTTLENRGLALVLRGSGATIGSMADVKGFVVLGDNSHLATAGLFEDIVCLPGVTARGVCREQIIVPD